MAAGVSAEAPTIRWPIQEPGPGTHFWDAQVLKGLRHAGAQLRYEHFSQPWGTRVLLAELADGREVAFDTHDSDEIVEEAADRSLVYFKFQYANEGYGRENVVPGGYTLANDVAYRYLPFLRRLRALRRFRHDVYARFGMSRGSEEIRREAVERLAEREDFRFEGGLFRYPGGPPKVPYRRHLVDVARTKVCVDMPGGGDFCTRLVDAFAVGSCVVARPHGVRLPEPLVDGVQLVYCRADLSDLGDVCAELVRDDERREQIARNGRDYFDRHLHRRRLGEYYVAVLENANGPR